MARRATAIIGACGEHYVAGLLSGNELVVAMPRGGTPSCDLLVTRQESGKAIRIQVKTGTEARRETKKDGTYYLWSTSYKVIDRNDVNLWYAFVWLNGWPKKDICPEVFFVPSDKVIACLKKSREENVSWPYFWMTAEEAKQYNGEAGLSSMLKSMSVSVD